MHILPMSRVHAALRVALVRLLMARLPRCAAVAALGLLLGGVWWWLMGFRLMLLLLMLFMLLKVGLLLLLAQVWMLLLGKKLFKMLLARCAPVAHPSGLVRGAVPLACLHTTTSGLWLFACSSCCGGGSGLWPPFLRSSLRPLGQMLRVRSARARRLSRWRVRGSAAGLFSLVVGLRALLPPFHLLPSGCGRPRASARVRLSLVARGVLLLGPTLRVVGCAPVWSVVPS